MTNTEIKALISLLDDDDTEVATHVEEKLRIMGKDVIPFLENQWEENSLNPNLQKHLEILIHDLQYGSVISRLSDWRKAGASDLLEGLWIIATYQYPDLSLDKLRQFITEIYLDAWIELRDETHPHDQVRVLNHLFYEKYNFASNTQHFHSPANSMINQVIESRKGNPISLCAIYLLVAQRLHIPLFGVNLPSLFVLTYKSSNIQFYINIFNKGQIFSKNDIDNYIKQLNIPTENTFYEPCSNLDIVKRFLRNLMLSFERNGDLDRTKEIEAILKAIMD